MMAKRAMTEEAKSAKAQLILDKAKEMFLDSDYEKIKMADIAKAIGISNGILFVYFKTKETLFIHLLWREYENRFIRLKEMAQSEKLESYGDIKKLLLTELDFLVDNNPLYIRLNSIRTLILEKNTDAETLHDMKKGLAEQVSELTSIISSSGILTQEQISDILLKEEAIIIGCYIEILTQLEFESFRRDFKREVLDTIGSYLDGFRYKALKS